MEVGVKQTVLTKQLVTPVVWLSASPEVFNNQESWWGSSRWRPENSVSDRLSFQTKRTEIRRYSHFLFFSSLPLLAARYLPTQRTNVPMQYTQTYVLTSSQTHAKLMPHQVSSIHWVEWHPLSRVTLWLPCCAHHFNIHSTQMLTSKRVPPNVLQLF